MQARASKKMPLPKGVILLEPGAMPLPGGLVLAPTVVSVDKRVFPVWVLNLALEDVWLPPKARLGILSEGHQVDRGACNVAFRRISTDHEEVTVSVRSMTETQGDFQCPSNRCVDWVKHEIPLIDDMPVAQAYRRIPPNQFEEVREHIIGLLRKGVIKESTSPYASPVVLVRKADGSLRLCVDYRKLNSKTQRNAFPLPRIDESLDALCNAQVFSSIDLASGYHQVAVHEKDQYKTAFVTPFGLYEYARMPFGLCNAPATFQRLMQAVMGDLVFQMVLVYLDDLLVYSNTFETHLSRLETVLC
ncbi:Transposon Ty3-I Gag-Pol poly [Labeo rohita]|uniref:ribonuclease H n=1 Tax=Labeo rohita TaxID=84645 RepID=A0A498P081_LABRO|nr:Transposon Ty3-I Gag-Pol poly [Labeo rohita]RXN37960.1 Transposon Ty3-I Gag-Pol poly [Labeo rohita]